MWQEHRECCIPAYPLVRTVNPAAANALHFKSFFGRHGILLPWRNPRTADEISYPAHSDEACKTAPWFLDLACFAQFHHRMWVLRSHSHGLRPNSKHENLGASFMLPISWSSIQELLSAAELGHLKRCGFSKNWNLKAVLSLSAILDKGRSYINDWLWFMFFFLQKEMMVLIPKKNGYCST